MVSLIVTRSAETQALKSIENGRVMTDAKEWRETINQAQLYKPRPAVLDKAGTSTSVETYDTHRVRAWDYFRGNQWPHMSDLLHRRFPNTWDDFDPYVLNTFKADAELDAHAYRRAPTRYLEKDRRPLGKPYREDGETVEPPGPAVERHEAFRELQRLARLDVVFPELEVMTEGLETMFGRITWADNDLAEKLGREHGPAIDLFPPFQVAVIPHPDHKGDLWAAVRVILCVGQSGNETRFEVWTRDHNDPALTLYRQEVTEIAGNNSTTVLIGDPVEWPLKRLPIFVAHSGLCQNSIFHDVNHDKLHVQESTNIGVMDHNLRQKLQAHQQLWTNGDKPRDGETWVPGPGRILQVQGENARIGAIPANADNTALEGITMQMRMQGLVNRQPPTAWSVDHGGQTSGYARQVENIPADSKREESQARWKMLEETDILPMLVEISDERGILDPIFEGAEGVRARVEYHPAEVYQEPEQRRLTSSLMQADGWISPASAAARGGAYPSVEAAVEAGLSIELEQAEPVGESASAVGGIAQNGAGDAEGGGAPNEESPRASMDASRRPLPVDPVTNDPQ